MSLLTVKRSVATVVRLHIGLVVAAGYVHYLLVRFFCSLPAVRCPTARDEQRSAAGAVPIHWPTHCEPWPQSSLSHLLKKGEAYTKQRSMERGVGGGGGKERTGGPVLNLIQDI